MSVIIRLQNLPWSANALDIRQYFSGLGIPEGGVHIVGGEQGDAFIAFSTDEDARQAFMRNNGKIKEVQITLMLSSRTEMQRVIEQARSQSFAAFMQPAPAVVPIPAAVPAVIPNNVTDVKKNKEKKESRRRSRSKSRDRRDRSRDRDRKDRRHRDRSRSRSRDRKSSRRRDRSRSRGRSRSRDRDRRNKDRKRSEDKSSQPFQRDLRKPMPEVWANQSKPLEIIPPAPQPPSLLGGFPVSLDQAKRTLGKLTAGLQLQGNGFPINEFSNNGNRNSRESWPPSNQNQNNFLGDQGGVNSYQDTQDLFQNRFQRNSFPIRGNPNRTDEPCNCAVALEPFYGGYGDVRRFFQGLFIGNNGIKFINDSNGRRTGVVYINFVNRKTKEDALRLDGNNLNGITVSVTHIDDEEFDEAVDRYTPVAHEDNSSDGSVKFKSKNITKYFNNPSNEPEIKDFSCLIVDDLPTYCKEQDILHMFSQHPLVALILTTKKKGGHIAYVKFSSKEVAKKAFEENTHHIVGGKQVTVKPCEDAEFNEVNKQHEVSIGSPKDEDVGTDCLSVSRLPQKTTDKDIADFFSDIGVIPSKIHLMSNNLGFTGQAYCEFANSEEASRAAKKHETNLGNLLVSVIPIKREEMDSILGTTLPAPEPAGPQQSAPLISQIDDKITPAPVIPSHPTRMTVPNSNMPGPGRPFIGRNFDNNGRPPRFGPRGPPARHRFGPPQEHQFEVPPGCTVYMNNVPYRAGTGDILEFFNGYNHAGNVSRRYNPNNTPSDEAKITFFDPDEASRAVADLQKHKIWDRQIFLRQE